MEALGDNTGITGRVASLIKSRTSAGNLVDADLLRLHEVGLPTNADRDIAPDVDLPGTIFSNNRCLMHLLRRRRLFSSTASTSSLSPLPE